MGGEERKEGGHEEGEVRGVEGRGGEREPAVEGSEDSSGGRGVKKKFKKK